MKLSTFGNSAVGDTGRMVGHHPSNERTWNIQASITFESNTFLTLTFVDPCIIVQFIKKYPTRCNSVSNFIIPYLYEAQHVSGDTRLIIRSLKLQWRSLVFHNTVEGCLGVSKQPSTVLWKTRGCQCSFRLLMMGGVSPETCWAS
jgi:hypothetical protein